ncbi:ROK family protein [Ascidiaceihabitans sp.]|uniref:ROK family transcriptional regulator n=1 Tax=Ascidiaceihabitans sp. TaxID=1872644 RepID=UPI0032990B07
MAFGHQREQGRRVLLRAIERHGPIPRIDLSQVTGISRATVTTTTADLLREGLIEEVPRQDGAETSRGRPRVDLKLRGNAHCVAGIKVSDTTISVMLSDFVGTELASVDVDLPKGPNAADALADRIANVVQTLAESIGKNLSDLSGVGVGLAGIVDAQNGTVYWSPSLSARNINFRDILSLRMGVPAFLDNDANLVAMAEKSFGLGRGHSDFIVVIIESGVGMGIVLNDQIYRGTRGCGAEFGHTKVQLAGALCRCGQRGCLEAYVADYAMLREAASVGAIDQTLSPTKQFEQLLAAAKAQDPTAETIVARAGHMFALGLANLVNVFDPELIILAGEQMKFDHLYAEEVIAEMRKSIVQIDKAPPEVVIHKWGNQMWASGAAAYALDFVYDMAAKDVREDAG